MLLSSSGLLALALPLLASVVSASRNITGALAYTAALPGQPSSCRPLASLGTSPIHEADPLAASRSRSINGRPLGLPRQHQGLPGRRRSVGVRARRRQLHLVRPSKLALRLDLPPAYSTRADLQPLAAMLPRLASRLQSGRLAWVPHGVGRLPGPQVSPCASRPSPCAARVPRTPADLRVVSLAPIPQLLIAVSPNPSAPPFVTPHNPSKVPPFALDALPAANLSLPYPLALRSVAPEEFFDARKGFEVGGLLKNPMILMMGLSAVLMFALPYITVRPGLSLLRLPPPSIAPSRARRFVPRSLFCA